MYTKVLLAVFVLYLSTAQCNDIKIGSPSPKATIVYDDAIDNELGYDEYKIVVVHAPIGTVIDAVFVTDLSQKKADVAKIESGGLGKEQVSIKLSADFIDYHFRITVYAVEKEVHDRA